jgi:hypothetical protein
LSQFIYTVWFKDHTASQEDQDYVYPVCIAIEAESAFLAKEWGDGLSKRFLQAKPENELLNSQIEPVTQYKKCNTGCLPFITYGYEPTDEEIGW